MDYELLDLADRLCAVAGMVMEDHNLMAVKTATDLDDRAAKLAALSIAGDDITKLIAAATVLARLG